MWIITGGTGFIGSQMIREFNQKGIHDLVVSDIVYPTSRDKTLKGCQFQKFVEAFELIERLKKNPNPFNPLSGVIHLGANSSTTETNWDLLKKLNLEFSKSIWKFCSENQIPLVYASSAATYGAGEKGYSDILSPIDLKTLNLYGESKRLFDEWALQETHTPPHWYGLKFFNVYGPGEYHKGDMASVVYKAYHQIQSSGKLKLFKSHRPDFRDGEQKRDFIYVKDVTRWILELFEKKPASGIYNMGYGEARTWNDLAHATFKALQKPVNIEYIDMPIHIRDQYQYFTEASMKKWSQAGMSRPQWDIELGVKDYILNYLKEM
jgi:ADP-L-glycero-D-manno-heptose 6-epimerase